ncbi:MAG: tRNA-dihydrouridine synthase [Nitrospirae bacterium]|nr:MAG: tRNA-dihydrouridine synthase [Nitrospirota bacterium]
MQHLNSTLEMVRRCHVFGNSRAELNSKEPDWLDGPTANFWHRLPRPIIGLSPMDGITDAAFREIIARHGCPDVIFTEFTHVHELTEGHPRAFDALCYTELQRPIVAQLYGNSPERFYQAAHIVCALGFDGIDINMGCPSKTVASAGSGAGLIRTPELALSILASTRQGILDWAAGQALSAAGIPQSVVDCIHFSNAKWGRPDISRRIIPVSVKTRLGYDTIMMQEWGACLSQGNPDLITVHGRTLTQLYRGEANWEAIAQVCPILHARGILVLGNGDIRSPRDAVRRIRESGVDGILIGRAAWGNPWIFQHTAQIRQAVIQETDLRDVQGLPSLTDRFRLMVEHAQWFEHMFGQKRFFCMRKHLTRYCTGFPSAASLRASMNRVSSAKDMHYLLDDVLKSHSAHFDDAAFFHPNQLGGCGTNRAGMTPTHS